MLASDFSEMKWVIGGWGSSAVISAGRDTKDHLRSAIQYLSENPKQAKLYKHTGWTQHCGKNVYLHAGGAVGTDDEISVQCDVRFKIAAGGGDLRAAIHRSLSTLNVAPHALTIPVFAAVQTAPLCSHAKVNTALWLHGRTGPYKSGLAGLVTSHYGAFSFDSHLENFQSTAIHMAGIGFQYKDALVTIDDYVPSTNPAQAKKQVDAVEQLMHNIGDNAGRGRATRDGSLRDGKPVRCLVLFTGEDPPPSKTASTNARLLLLEVKRGEISRDKLMEIERHRDELQRATRGYLEWLAPQLDSVAEIKHGEVERFRAALPAGTHDRVAAGIGTLSTGMRLYVRYALESGALTSEQHDELLRQLVKINLPTSCRSDLRWV